jgi:hypothetical protein
VPFTWTGDNCSVISSIMAASFTSFLLLGVIRWWEER